MGNILKPLDSFDQQPATSETAQIAQSLATALMIIVTVNTAVGKYLPENPSAPANRLSHISTGA